MLSSILDFILSLVINVSGLMVRATVHVELSTQHMSYSPRKVLHHILVLCLQDCTAFVTPDCGMGYRMPMYNTGIVGHFS